PPLLPFSSLSSSLSSLLSSPLLRLLSSPPLLSPLGNPLSLVDLVPVLQNTLKDESSVTCKMACSAVRHCIMTLCSSTLSELGLHLLVDLLTLKDCSYWLVRTELLETLAEMDFR
uniref:Uncharacterized protein n=1 Tax=Hucho hucho TaxID=62062 RepID=A0A4W5L171_9TELE